MVRKMFAKLTAGAVFALALAWAGQAEAGWRWHGSSGGSSGGWGGSSGGSWGGSSGGWGGSSGGSWGGRGFFGHHRRGWGGGWGSSGGSSGGWGSSGGSSGGYWGGSSGGFAGGSSGGSSGGGAYYYSPSYGTPTYGTPTYGPGIEMTPVDPSTTPPASAPPAGGAPAPAPAPGTSTLNTRADGLLAVRVPDDAKIYVNGQATTSTGDMRQYVSRDLRTGYNYTYEVRAEVVRDGRTVEQVKKVDLRAGETANLAFDFPTTASTETSLTLHVPSDAKVYLAGNATKAGGQTRIFRTTGLSGGKTWEGYTVRVELERDGRMISKEETISLRAGQSQELRFDFDGDQIALAR
jgi:uncharacterized protein (TIGR03000 family)